MVVPIGRRLTARRLRCGWSAACEDAPGLALGNPGRAGSDCARAGQLGWADELAQVVAAEPISFEAYRPQAERLGRWLGIPAAARGYRRRAREQRPRTQGSERISAGLSQRRILARALAQGVVAKYDLRGASIPRSFKHMVLLLGLGLGIAICNRVPAGRICYLQSADWLLNYDCTHYC